MYLPERLKAYPMKSLYSGVLLAMVITLSLSFLVFHAIANRVQRKSIDPAFERIDELELESARGALASGGPKALKAYLIRLDRVFAGSTHYLLDAKGVDVLTGENRAEWLPPRQARNGVPMRTAITSKLSGRRTGSIGSSTWDCLKSAAYLDVSSLLFPCHRRHLGAVLAGLNRRSVAHPQNRGLHCSLRAG